MEKVVVKQRKILTFLPKAISSTILTFQVSPPISPIGKGSSSSSSSAPIIVSLIPKEAPRKSKNGSFDAREPASPKVSCMGQIKCNKKKNKKQAVMSKSKVASASASSPAQAILAEQAVKRKLLKGTKRGHKSNVFKSKAKTAEAKRVPFPSLGQMKHFSSARGTLSDFDWKACDQAGEATGFVTINPLYEEKGLKFEKVVVNVNGVQKTRKAKLWNRRTTTRLTPLQL